MILAALDDGAKRDAYAIAIEAAKEVMSGTPDAARHEPWTWITWVGVVVLVVTVVGLLLRFLAQMHKSNTQQTEDFVQQGREFTQAVRENNQINIEMQQRCHDHQIATIKIASDAAHAATGAAHAAAGAAHETKALVGEVKTMVSHVMERLA